ncbi:XRE family transcriptional regulator [Peribacillus saganii]|uniref:XRE family transcriptional regulator n=1 Tax=Peribacillus saganii TaxID=2303992 RepID=A0A372LPH2_9BACI|nr:helix-turn-helix transcriptional regulator [Peribacillus saganii]RFU69863.1 XRE family transcriptional regulator [Peribacillus saganii]
MNQIIPRHNEIGDKIRAARKTKGMTLEELAEGICSLGKMSQIENGRQPVTEQQLTELCIKLELPMSYFSDPDINAKLKEMDYLNLKIRDLIELQQWEYAKSELKLFSEKVESYQIPSRKIDFHFLSGIFYLKTDQSQLAEAHLFQVIDAEEKNNYNLRLKLDAYNLLASIMFSRKNISQSFKILDKAMELSSVSPTVTKIERDKIYFNRAILYICTASKYQAIQNINKINHYMIAHLETDYMKLLVQLLDDNSLEDVRETLLSLREKQQQTNDAAGILRGWALTIYTSLAAYPKNDIGLQLKEHFLSDLDMFKDIPDQREQCLAVIQLSIYVSLHRNDDTSFITDLIKRAKPFVTSIKDPLLIARHFFLEGQFYKRILQDTLSSHVLFQKAYETLKDDGQSILKADILYELCKKEKSDSKVMTALDIYHSHLESQFLFTHFYDLTLPAFKY